jgi:hypothetical protein
MGRTPETVTKTFSAPGGHQKTITLNYLHGKTRFVDQVKAAFDCINIYSIVEFAWQNPFLSPNFLL